MSHFPHKHALAHPGLALARVLRDAMIAPPPPDLKSALLRAQASDPGPFDYEAPDEPCAATPDIPPPAPVGFAEHPKPVVSRLALTLSLAEAMAAAGVARIGETVGITRIGGWGVPSADGLKAVLRGEALADSLLAAPARVAVIGDATAGGQAERDRAFALRQQQTEVSKALLAGQAVVLIAPDDAGLSPAQKPLVETVLTLPRPNRRMIAALFSLLWPDAEETDAALLALPRDEDLGRLSALQLEAALRRPDPGAAAAALARIAAQMMPEARGPGLEAIVGQPEVVQRLEAVAGDLTAWRAGKLDWARVPRSLLLYGPPGNGKTAAARALAGHCRLPLVVTSFAEAQGKGLHLGQTLAALREAFDSAIQQAPAILFIDEIDALGTRTIEAQHNDFYVRAIVTGMLTMIDRALRTPGLILMAATNDAESMDPALRRAGRFDQHIAVPAPRLEGLAEILRRALGAEAPDIDAAAIQAAARRLSGGSGAEAEALGRLVLARARAAGRPATAADLTACLDARRPEATPELMRRIALHEAGHIVVGHLAGLPPPRSASASLTSAGVVHPMPPLMTLPQVEATLVSLLAGRVAEQHFLGDVSTGGGHGTSSDLAEATRLALHIDHAWHLPDDTPLVWSDVSTAPRPGMLPRDIARAVSERLRRAEARARALVEAHADEVMAIAIALDSYVELDGEQIAQLLAENLPPPEMRDEAIEHSPGSPR